PHAIPEVVESSEAVLSAWYPGPQGGQAIAEVLFGDVNPSGKLPVTMPRSSMQLPVYYNYKDSGGQIDYHDMKGAPLYPFGYGLSYTTFIHAFAEDDSISITRDELLQSKNVAIDISVTNTGERAGYDVVQLYITHMQASVAPRVRELKDFRKVWLEAGETKTITLTLDYESLAIWDINMNKVVEPGLIKLQVGNDSTASLMKELSIY